MSMNQQEIIVPRAPTQEELGQAIQQRQVDFNALSYFKKGWVAFKANFCAFWGFIFVYLIISVAAIYISWKGYCMKFGKPDFSGIDWNHVDNDDKQMHKRMQEMHEKIPTSFIVWALATFLILYFFVWAPMKSSFFRASFKALRTNSQLACADIFSSFHCPYWCRLLWLTIVFTVVSGVFGAVSALLVGFFCMFSYGLHADNDHIPLGVFSSLKFSTQAVFRHFCGILAFCVLSMILNIVGFISVVGLLITLPLTWFSYVFLYHDVIRINGFPVVASVELRHVTVQAPIVSVAPGGYTQLREFHDIEGAC